MPPDGWSLRDNGANARTIWLLSRGCYATRILDLANVPVAKRDSAIRLAIAGWSPFADTSHYIIPTPQGAILCAWESKLVLQRGEQLGVAPDNVRVIPETALRREVEKSSTTSAQNQPYAHLFAALDGYIGAVLNADRTLAEQWWPELPTRSHWQNFLRSAGLAAAAETLPPEPKNTTWRSQAIGYPANTQASNFSTTEALAVWFIAVALTIPTVWYGNQLRQIYAATQESGERLRQTEKDLDSVLRSRELALSTQDRAMKLAGILDPVEHLRIFTLINNVVTQNSWQDSVQLNEWEVRPQTLKFSLVAIAGTPPAATTLVKALEKVQIFRDVEAKLDGSRINVTLKLAPIGGLPPQIPAGQPTTPMRKAGSLSLLLLPSDENKCSVKGQSRHYPELRQEA